MIFLNTLKNREYYNRFPFIHHLEPGGTVVKNPVQETKEIIFTPWFPKEGNGDPLQYSCLENSMDRGAWRATVYGVIESDMTAHPQTELTNSGCLSYLLQIYSFPLN